MTFGQKLKAFFFKLFLGLASEVVEARHVHKERKDEEVSEKESIKPNPVKDPTEAYLEYLVEQALSGERSTSDDLNGSNDEDRKSYDDFYNFVQRCDNKTVLNMMSKVIDDRLKGLNNNKFGNYQNQQLTETNNYFDDGVSQL